MRISDWSSDVCSSDLKTACIDAFTGKDGKPALGGTCLNVGCILSKALLDSSRQFWNIAHNLPVHGISVGDAKVDMGTFIGRKDKIVKRSEEHTSELQSLMRISYAVFCLKNKIQTHNTYITSTQ